ncbi:glycosyltransferase family 2 protein [Vibrio proteolyticus]|uniref:Glycosyltransferase n=1 Tax=Vibrio proteolyticus NBRC 13287 TaxID=1219065 RepID=U2ZW91_VIBPR|nr:glycosyltransferase family 2 protein [Vibrio proteolyticus]GAD65347.1 hypothetical protein VPR01S_01_01190 [Vibrio proteolyticus NBRC 13287]
MNDLLLMLICVCSGVLIVYHHVGYPILLSWYFARHPQQQPVDVIRGYRCSKKDRKRASVTILVPAYNEERWIADKIRNLATLDYPRDKLTVYIACDGCTDRTVAIAQDTIQEGICDETHFEILDFNKNRGKVAVINDVMSRIQSDITALSDVSALISVDALLVAEQHFKKPAVGVVDSYYRLLQSESTAEEAYWYYQHHVRKKEASLGSALGAHGAFYLFRTHLFEPLQASTINDDFILPMNIVRKGYRTHYADDVMSLEMETTDQSADFRRRLRISAGNMQQLIQLRSLFLPRYKGVAFAFLSGKGLRLLTPYLMLLCIATSALLHDYTLFRTLFFTQLLLFAIAAAGSLIPRLKNWKPINLITYLIAGHLANLLGGLKYLVGLESGRWTRVNR